MRMRWRHVKGLGRFICGRLEGRDRTGALGDGACEEEVLHGHGANCDGLHKPCSASVIHSADMCSALTRCQAFGTRQETKQKRTLALVELLFKWERQPINMLLAVLKASQKHV